MFAKKKILFNLFSIISFIFIPIFILTIILYSTTTSKKFYLSLIKQLNPIETFIEATNLQTEQEVMRQIEKETELSSFRPKFKEKERDYKNKLTAFNQINKTVEFKKLEEQIDSLEDMDWNKAPETFKDKKSFQKFKTTTLENLEKKLDEIKEYRDQNEDSIEELEDSLDDARDSFEDAQETLEDKEDQARDILQSRREQLSNTLIADMGKIAPKMTEKLNSLFIDREISRIIELYIDYFSNYEKHKNAGKIFTKRLDIKSGMIENTRIVKIPGIEINLYTDIEEKGNTTKKHIFSEIIPSVIDSTLNLSNPWLLKKIFTLSDSWIAETMGRSFLEKWGLTIKNGKISSSEIIFQDKQASVIEFLMMSVTYGKYLLFLLPTLILTLILSIIMTAKNKRNGVYRTGIILQYSSAIMAVTLISTIIISLNPLIFLPEINFLNNIMIKEISEHIIFISSLYLLIPAIIIFLIISAGGSYLIKKSGCQ